MFVLIHSPLVGVFSWSLVAEEMRRRGEPVLVPTLQDSPESNAPYWQQHAESVANALRDTTEGTPIILVAHSGAGPLLPAISAASPRPVAGYIFVDAGLLFQNASHLDLRAAENKELAYAFERDLKNGARFPDWTADDLAEIIPDAATREALVNDLHPRGLDFFRETLPVFSFPDAPCTYLQLTDAYAPYVRQALTRRWRVEKMTGGHFYMLVAPAAVTTTLQALASGMNSRTR